MKKSFWCSLLSVLLIGQTVYAGSIKVIVNDVPISSFDVTERAKMLSFQQAGHIGEFEQMEPIALDELIEEQIKIQEAEKQGIKITEQEINEALAHLEEQSGLPAGGFKTMFEKEDISYQTLKAQTQANLGWIRIIHQSGRTVSVSDADVDARKEIIRKDLSKETVSFAEIIVPTEDEARQVWLDLQNGTPFNLLVIEKSIADSRVTGGRIMNVEPDYYGTEIAEIFYQMQVGQLSRPIKVEGGYAIFLMLNKREALQGDTITVWDLMQAIVPMKSIADTLLKEPVKNGCEGFYDIVKDDVIPETLQRGKMSPAQLPSDLSPLLQGASFNQLVGPVPTPAGNLYLMKCGSEEKNLIPSDLDLKIQIENEKMDLLSKQMILELKRDTVIDYK